MRRSLAAVLAAVALFALPACGSPEAGSQRSEPGVATLQSAAPQPAASASKQPERPRERLDTTAEEFEAMLKPYNECMTEQGVGSVDKRRRATAVKPATAEENEKWEAAHRVCEPQFFPLPPWERDPANPESRDFAVGVVKCLKEKGVKFVAVSDDGISIALGGEKNHARSISLGLDKMPECERAVAAAMKD